MAKFKKVEKSLPEEIPAVVPVPESTKVRLLEKAFIHSKLHDAGDVIEWTGPLAKFMQRV